jgi:DNA-binding NarL/FixJ family response regulator
MSNEQEVIRVVVVDDHLVVREGLRMMLELAGEGFALVGDAADGATDHRFPDHYLDLLLIIAFGFLIQYLHHLAR